jgi:hypothetical protein
MWEGSLRRVLRKLLVSLGAGAVAASGVFLVFALTGAGPPLEVAGIAFLAVSFWAFVWLLAWIGRDV